MAREVDMPEPPEIVLLKAMGVSVEKLDDNDWALQFVIHPLKMVSVRITDEGKDILIRQLTGGVALPTAGDVAAVRG